MVHNVLSHSYSAKTAQHPGIELERDERERDDIGGGDGVVRDGIPVFSLRQCLRCASAVKGAEVEVGGKRGDAFDTLLDRVRLRGSVGVGVRSHSRVTEEEYIKLRDVAVADAAAEE
jgi:hypothetical protein